ncbi:hypothetical protein FHS07_003073 [Microbacterium proteolyticum]|uniref:Uncharacterized protein n=1 Tax=Microbacterium proteolyticum TaxID=1572644 RepID=A0A7W5GH18_9MICO|nr:hypothetical protein [Microbacterium proteolyticum]MBB3159355.1 hypothetical protein [Microbacterium proteolyticum]
MKIRLAPITLATWSRCLAGKALVTAQAGAVFAAAPVTVAAGDLAARAVTMRLTAPSAGVGSSLARSTVHGAPVTTPIRTPGEARARG